MLREEIVKNESGVYFKKAIYEENPIVNAKARRAYEVATGTVTVGGVEFDADEKSMDRLSRVMSVAQWKYTQAIIQGATPAAAYQTVYRDATIPWKITNNTLIQLDIETAGKVLKQTLDRLGEIWTRYG